MNDLFRARLKSAREASGLTQEDIASVCIRRNGNPISRAAVAQWESGESYPAAEFLPAIARILNISLDYLFGLSPQSGTLPKEALQIAISWDTLPPSAKKIVQQIIDLSAQVTR